MKLFDKDKEVILLSTHFVDEGVLDKYRRIKREVDADRYDVILLLNLEEGDIWNIPKDVDYFMTDSDSINALGYVPITESLLPGSCHFPVLRFYLSHLQYKCYWFVEYDVEFKGIWSVLIDDCSRNLQDYDFLSCHVEKYDKLKNGSWMWWRLGNELSLPLKDCVKGFNPICRYSNRALSYLDKYQKQGNCAHSELLITTSLYKAGYKIGDMGGTGEFVPKGFQQKFYISENNALNDGTVRYRPVYTHEEIINSCYHDVLYHPLKIFYC